MANTPQAWRLEPPVLPSAKTGHGGKGARATIPINTAGTNNRRTALLPLPLADRYRFFITQEIQYATTDQKQPHGNGASGQGIHYFKYERRQPRSAPHGTQDHSQYNGYRRRIHQSPPTGSATDQDHHAHRPNGDLNPQIENDQFPDERFSNKASPREKAKKP